MNWNVTERQVVCWMNSFQKGVMAEEAVVTVTVLEEDGLSLSSQKVTTMATLMLVLTRSI